MILRWRLVGSMVVLVAGLFVVALVIVFWGENGEEPEGPTAHTTAVATPTVRPIAPTRTRGPGTPSVTGTPELTEPGESEVVPSAESPVLAPAGTPVQVIPGEAPPAPPLPGETATPIPVSPLPDETAIPIPPSPRPSPLPTLTPTPIPALPDLVVRDLRVRRDRIVVVIGNDGEGDVLAGQTVEIGVRGIVAESQVMPVTLSKGEGLTILLEDQVLYKREKVMGRVDPNDLIPEEDDNNNSFTKELLPDVPVDLGVVALLAVGTEQHLAVYIRNNTEVPILGADVSIQVFRSDPQEPATTARQTLNLDPFEIAQVDIFHQVATRGVFFRVVMEVINLPDADPLNNTFEGTIP
ncbi:MAG: hypothetical protein WBF66_07875 [Dehalococcoidia bacterium]